MQPVTPAGALIGRDREMAVLSGLLKEAARGRGRAVLVEGEPGIGKSALVRAAVGQATEPACEVFWGAGDELDQALPLLPFLDGLRVREPSPNVRRTAIVQLLRGEVAIERTDVPSLLAEQLLALVTEQCETRPSVIVIDDLQWADPASIRLWRRLARAAPRLRLLLVGTLRPVPRRDDLLALRRLSGEVDRIELGGLGDAAAAKLVAALVGGKPAGDLMRLADGAAGNPLYLTELAAALTRSASLTLTDAGTAELIGADVPGSLSAAIADRLDFVTRPARDVLRAAALLGAEFTITDLATVLSQNVTAVIPAVDEACAAGVLAATGELLGFRHPLIRAALYNAMSASVRVAWHHDAGRALAEARAPVDRVARQLLPVIGSSPALAGQMDGWMLGWLAAAGDLLVGQAPAVAVELLARAVDITPAASPEYGRLASQLAGALYRTGDTTASERVAMRALEHVRDPDLLVGLHRTLAQCRGQTGSAAESLATLHQALASPQLSAGHRAQLLVLAAGTHVTLGELQEAAGVAARARAAAQEAGDSWAMAWALHVLTVVTVARGNMTTALPLFDQALAVTRSDPSLTDLRLLLQVNKAITLGSLDRYEEGLAVAEQTRDLASQIGTGIRLDQAQSALSQLYFETGRWDDALANTGFVPEDLNEPRAACCQFGIAAVISFHRGDNDAAREHLAAADAYASMMGERPVALLAMARALGHEQAGNPAQALAVLVAVVDQSCGEMGDAGEVEEVEDLLPWIARLGVLTGDLSAARDADRRAAALADMSEVPHRQANALYCRGLLDHDPAPLLVAADRYQDAGRPLEAAQALEATAGQFIEADDREQARGPFTRAVEAYLAIGATADAARLQQVFRAFGIRRGPHTPHRRARSGWDALTPTEVNVVAFVEAGLSNPEIAARLLISPRTVATHVSSILKKLDVHSRTDIAVVSATRHRISQLRGELTRTDALAGVG